MAGLDVTQHPAGSHRSELLIITDQPNTAPAADDELDGGVQGQGVGHPGFVDDHQRRPADVFRPIGHVTVVDGPGELGQRVGRCAGGVAELRSCGGDGASPNTWPPLSLHARARVRMAVVFPAPAGAIANRSRASEVHMARTRAACPASKAFPLAADSSSARSTAPASTIWPSLRPAAPTSCSSAARIRAEVNSSDPETVYTLEPSARRKACGLS